MPSAQDRRNQRQPMADLTEPAIVEVSIRKGLGGKPTLWVNVDGICKLRAVGCAKITLEDEPGCRIERVGR